MSRLTRTRLTESYRFRVSLLNSIPFHTIYDSSGNIITDAEGRSFSYDAENKQKTASNSQNQPIGEYFYDGDGKRVKKVTNSEIVIFVYDALGKLVAEYSTQLSETPQTQYLTNDHLGSPRINTDQNGQIVSRSDYLPYGEEIVGLGGRSSSDKYVTDEVRQGFTGFIKDEETGLDFAQARMYKKELGRFTGADRIFMTLEKPSDPQQLNLYIYVRNNPLRFIDPTGNLINVKGSHKERYLRDLEAIIGIPLTYDPQGNVQIDGDLPDDLSFVSSVGLQLLVQILDPNSVVEIEATSGRDDVLGGQFLGGGKQIIDYGDFDSITGGNGLSALGIVAHETIEAISGLINGVPEGTRIPPVRDHNAGIDAENVVRKSQGLPLRTKGGESDRGYRDPQTGKQFYIQTISFGDYEQVITREISTERSTSGFSTRVGPPKSEVNFVGQPDPDYCLDY